MNRSAFDVLVSRISLSLLRHAYEELEPGDRSNVLDQYGKKDFADLIWNRISDPVWRDHQFEALAGSPPRT